MLRPSFREGIPCFCSHPCLLILLLFLHRSIPCCRITGSPNKHHPGPRPVGIRSQQSKLPEEWFPLAPSAPLCLQTPPGSLGDVAPDLGERDCCKDIVPGPVTAHAVLTWEPVCQGEERAQLSPRVPFPPSIPSRGGYPGACSRSSSPSGS